MAFAIDPFSGQTAGQAAGVAGGQGIMQFLQQLIGAAGAQPGAGVSPVGGAGGGQDGFSASPELQDEQALMQKVQQDEQQLQSDQAQGNQQGMQADQQQLMQDVAALAQMMGGGGASPAGGAGGASPAGGAGGGAPAGGGGGGAPSGGGGGGSPVSGGGGGAPSGGGGGGTPVSGGGGGTPVSGGGGSGGTGNAGGAGGAGTTTGTGGSTPIQATGNGAGTVNLASKYLGMPSEAVKGKLPGYQAAGGVTNNCADFVSSVLANSGRFQGHDINVGQFQQHLLQQGYKPVTQAQAQPGDVWLRNDSGMQHTEIVSAPGGTSGIGANGTSHETISNGPLPSGGTFYHLSTPAGGSGGGHAPAAPAPAAHPASSSTHKK